MIMCVNQIVVGSPCNFHVFVWFRYGCQITRTFTPSHDLLVKARKSSLLDIGRCKKHEYHVEDAT